MDAILGLDRPDSPAAPEQISLGRQLFRCSPPSTNLWARSRAAATDTRSWSELRPSPGVGPRRSIWSAYSRHPPVRELATRQARHLLRLTDVPARGTCSPQPVATTLGRSPTRPKVDATVFRTAPSRPRSAATWVCGSVTRRSPTSTDRSWLPYPNLPTRRARGRGFASILKGHGPRAGRTRTGRPDRSPLCTTPPTYRFAILLG